MLSSLKLKIFLKKGLKGVYKKNTMNTKNVMIDYHQCNYRSKAGKT